MSRRHHGGRPHRTNGHAPALDGARPSAEPTAAAESPRGTAPHPAAGTATAGFGGTPPDGVVASEATHLRAADDAARHPNGGGETNGHGDGNGPRPWGSGPGAEVASAVGCTAPQLRRFIKSRPYVPMHELRRRFGINGGEDDVTPVDLGVSRVFVGLPAREGALLGELLRGGEIGYELSLDPRSPVVVGLYPMRPVARG